MDRDRAADLGSLGFVLGTVVPVLLLRIPPRSVGIQFYAYLGIGVPIVIVFATGIVDFLVLGSGVR